MQAGRPRKNPHVAAGEGPWGGSPVFPSQLFITPRVHRVSLPLLSPSADLVLVMWYASSGCCLQGVPVWVGSGADGKPQSMLWFEGPRQVHGLFQFLFLEGQRVYGPDCDLPQLLAPVPFLGAAIHQLQPSVRPYLLLWMAYLLRCPRLVFVMHGGWGKGIVQQCSILIL